MKMMNRVPLPIRVSAVLLTFSLYVVITAGYLNQPPTATAALPFPVMAEPLPAPPVHSALVPEQVTADSGGTPEVCQDAVDQEDLAWLFLADEEAQPPRSDDDPPETPQKPEPPFHRLILQAADTHNIEPALIKAVILAESNYNPKAVSKRGARGLMQLMPRTAAALGVEDLFDPAENINGGVKYLRQLLDRFDNDLRLALAAYNAGSRHVRNYNGVPPFNATRLYIKKVFKYKDIFQEEMSAGRQTV
jgi:soluble lytic murein transglycosylase-like protein